MKKYLLILFVFVAALSACKKETTFDASAQAAADDAQIIAYLKTAGITNAVKDPSGLYYVVTKAGTGAYPTASSTVTVNYTGKLMSSGSTFDSNTSTKFSLLSVIPGWRFGLQHINPGGSITLYVPSALGYANNETGPIPANSVLIFNIDLLSIN